jgi:6-phosphogluconolactonase
MNPARTTPQRVLERNGAQIYIFSNTAQLSAAAADEFFRVVGDALAMKPRCSIALAGGSTPKSLYSLLRTRIDAHEAPPLDWSSVDFFFSDERCVPPEHPDSNYKMAMESLFTGTTLPHENIYRIRAELSPKEAAEEYDELLRNKLASALPRFDLILLGMGPDGHTGSLFPGTSALAEKRRLVVENFVPKLDTFRITFTFPLLNHTAEVMFLTGGMEKQQALSQAVAKDPQVPAGLVHPEDGKLLWMVTEDAAALLRD